MAVNIDKTKYVIFHWVRSCLTIEMVYNNNDYKAVQNLNYIHVLARISSQKPQPLLEILQTAQSILGRKP